jgi:TonB-dependent SusC/RagA subfamily outer membrane receptor
MTPNRFIVIAAASLTLAPGLAAQGGRVTLRGEALQRAPGSCAGPGAALGVIGFQCASCTITQEGGGAAFAYSFSAEPVITQVTATSVLRPGDVIEAVAGKPITTSEGAFAFASPAELLAYARFAEVDPKDIVSVEIIKGAAAAQMYGAKAANGIVTITTRKADGSRRTTMIGDSILTRAPAFLGSRPLFVIDGVVQPPPAAEIAVQVRRDGRSVALSAPVAERCDDDPKARPSSPDTARTLPAGPPSAAEPTGRFGLAVSCAPSCTRARARDGTDYWKFDGYPPIAALRPGGPAEKVGLKVGDRVTDIDGLSILTEEGALRFLRNESKRTMQVTVLRSGERIAFLVIAKVSVQVGKIRLRPDKPGT